MKELLKIVNVKDAICEASINFSTQKEREMTAAAMLSLMDQDEDFAKAVMSACTNYVMRRKEVAGMNVIAMRNGKIKTQN